MLDFILLYLYDFSVDLSLGIYGNAGEAFGIYSALYNWTTGDWGFLVQPLLYPIIGLWFSLKFSIAVIQQAVQIASDFVNLQIRPIWGYLLNDVQYLLNWVDGAYNYVYQIAANVFNWLSAAWTDAINFAQWLWNNGYDILTRFIWNTWEFLRPFVNWFIDAFFAPYASAINWLITLFNLAAQFLIAFVSDPIGFIANIARQIADALLSPFRPLLDFLSWWQTVGSKMLTAFVNNPVGFIFDMIESRFIDWLLRLVALSW